jgi:hypothetical protein
VTTGRQLVGAVAVLVLMIGALLWRPLVTGGYYAPSDVLQGSPLSGVAPKGYSPRNGLLSDPAAEMLPWLEWNRTQLAAGHLPVWNPYDGSGAPHLANYQSAVFSVFSAPFYVLPFRLALVAQAGLRLLLLGLFTYLFLRRVRLGHVGSLVGAVAFMFGAYNLVWLNWPHPAAAVALPAGLYFAELALQARDRSHRLLGLAGYTLALTAGALAGHPETLFYSIVLVVAWIVVRLAAERSALRLRLARGAELAGASLLAVGLAAVQLVPFAEYVSRSFKGGDRGATYLQHLETRLTFLHVFPSLFGNPATRYYDPGHYLGLQNYNEANGAYVGVFVLFLAAVGLATLWRRRTFAVIFFAAAALLWLLYAYDVAGAGRLVGSLPVLRSGLVARSQEIWLMACAALAATGVDALLSARWGRRVAVALGAAGAVVIVGATVGAEVVLRHLRADPASLLRRHLARVSSSAHVRFIVLTFVAGVAAAVALVLWHRRPRARAAAAVALVGVVFAQSGFMLRDYNPTVPRRYFYPSTPAVRALKAKVGNDRVYAGVLLPADVNQWYRVVSVDNYDGLGVRRHDDLLIHLRKATDAGGRSRLFNRMGVRWLVTTDPVPFPADAGDPALRTADGPNLSGPLDQGVSVVQGFRATRGGLSALVVGAAPTGPGQPCSVDVAVEEAATGRTVARASSPCAAPPDPTVLAFAGVPDSAGTDYRAVFSGHAAIVLAPGAVGVPLRAGPAESASHVVATVLASEVPEIEPAGDLGGVGLFRVRGSPAKYFSPPEARVVGQDAEAVAVIDGRDFDPARTVLLDGGVPSSGAAGEVTVRREAPTEIGLDVRRDTPGYLVALQASYPGWEATVNGRPAVMRRADTAFVAVPVGAGTSHVVLRYRPSSVRLGLVLTGISLVVLLAVVAYALVSRPHLLSRRRGRR